MQLLVLKSFLDGESPRHRSLKGRLILHVNLNCWEERSSWDRRKAKRRLEFPPNVVVAHFVQDWEEVDIWASHPPDMRWTRRWKKDPVSMTSKWSREKGRSQKGRTVASIHSCCQVTNPAIESFRHCPVHQSHLQQGVA